MLKSLDVQRLGHGVELFVLNLALDWPRRRGIILLGLKVQFHVGVIHEILHMAFGFAVLTSLLSGPMTTYEWQLAENTDIAPSALWAGGESVRSQESLDFFLSFQIEWKEDVTNAISFLIISNQNEMDTILVYHIWIWVIKLRF